jgi:trehalose-6-phosphate synthase
MSLDERRQRNAANFKVLVANDIAHWADRFMAMLEQASNADNGRVRVVAGR